MHPIFGNSCLPSKQHLGCTDLFSYLKRTSKRNRGSQCHIWLNIWVLILVLSFTSCVTLAKLQNPSESKFHHLLDNINRGFHGGSVIKNLPASAEDMGLIPGSGRSPGVRNGSLLQYSYLENSMDKRAWWATVHRVAKSGTWLKWLSTA